MQEMERSISFDGRDIRLKFGLMAPQAGGAILIESGETSVFVTATQGGARDGIDFLPLVVDYEERLYAAGRFPGGFLRREGRPPEKAILTGRLIDRPMRPLIGQWLREDIQIVATTMSMDVEVPPDVLAVTGASIATLLAKIPFQGPMAAVRVGLIGDDFIINPTYSEVAAGDLDLIVAGTPDGVVMVEAGANQLPEQDVIEAIEFGYEAVQDLIQAQRDLLADLGIEMTFAAPPGPDEAWKTFLKDRAQTDIEQILSHFDYDKATRDAALDEVKANKIVAAIAELPDDDPFKVAVEADGKLVGKLFKSLTRELMRRQIIEQNVRVDGRTLDQVRPVTSRVGILPRRVHGSGLFTRGLTQVLSLATLG
ncbi:MAG: polyribonucleotide nucleotidyltransferase, partial [Cyanobacteria bacterium J06641_5]